MSGFMVHKVTQVKNGPLLMQGPVEIEMDDGSTVRSDRFVVALCTCRRSRTAPFCDTSHRRKVRDDG
jgi:CDGSH-type Zn-finger protein